MDRLAIIDWGIGGVSIYKLIDKQMRVPVTYFSDTGAIPYGKMSRKELVDRLNSVISWLKQRGVTHVVIGCNAASTAIPFLQDHAVPIYGIVETAVEKTAALKPPNLGLIGGRRTVVSRVYRKAFSHLGINVKQRIAQRLSGLIETGDVSSSELHEHCGRILAPLSDCSHILLACTHYPAISAVLKQYVASTTQLIDPVGDLVRKVKTENLKGVGDNEFLTSGDAAAMKRAAKAAFGIAIPTARKVVA